MFKKHQVIYYPVAMLAAFVLAAAACAANDHQKVSKRKASPVMQINFVRSGGFAGAATNVAGTVQFDENGAHVNGEATDYHRDLTPQEVEQLRTVADPGSLASSKAAVSSPGPARDAYQYDINVVTKDGKSHSLNLGQGDLDQLQKVAPGAAHLASWIQEEAQKIWSYRVSNRK